MKIGLKKKMLLRLNLLGAGEAAPSSVLGSISKNRPRNAAAYQTQDSGLQTQYSFRTMGQLGFIFCAAVAFWLVKDGVEEVGQFAQAAVPILADSTPSWQDVKEKVGQTVSLGLMPSNLLFKP